MAPMLPFYANGGPSIVLQTQHNGHTRVGFSCQSWMLHKTQGSFMHVAITMRHATELTKVIRIHTYLNSGKSLTLAALPIFDFNIIWHIVQIWRGKIPMITKGSNCYFSKKKLILYVGHKICFFPILCKKKPFISPEYFKSIFLWKKHRHFHFFLCSL